MSAAPVPLSGRVAVDATARQLPSVGDVINGKYLIEAFIGEGGVGLVVAAQNIELDERVALKFLRPEMLAQTDIVARFMREAKAACSIKSEYVANVYDVGTMADGSPFLVMEYLEGKDVGSVIKERGHLGYREATEYVMQTCEALAVAHAKGVVHRDIKPENLFLTSRAAMSVIKVLDFGISKAALTGSIFGSALPLVKTVSLMGTPLYMSPEQVRDAEAVDSRSDIWSLGMVLYEALTGTLPYNASSITELCAAILEQPLAPISNYRSDLPAGFVDVLQRCLEKDPNARFQNVAEMAIAFMPFAPKRARICAERAAQALRAAGLAEESSVRFASTMPPPQSNPHPSSNPAITQPSVPSAPSMPRFESTGDYPAAPPAAVSAPPMFEPPRQSRAKLIAAFVGVACVAAMAAVLATRMGDGHGAPAPTATASHEVAPPSEDPSAVKLGATQAPPTTAITATATATATGQGPTAQGKKPVFSWPPKTPPAPSAPVAKTAAAAVPPSAPAPRKTAEEPDLGY